MSSGLTVTGTPGGPLTVTNSLVPGIPPVVTVVQPTDPNYDLYEQTQKAAAQFDANSAAWSAQQEAQASVPALPKALITVSGGPGGPLIVQNNTVPGLPSFTVEPNDPNYAMYAQAQTANQQTTELAEATQLFWRTFAGKFGDQAASLAQDTSGGDLPSGVSYQQAYNAHLAAQQFAGLELKTGGSWNPLAGDTWGPGANQSYTDAWASLYNQNHESFFGKFGDAVGGLVGGAVRDVGGVLGGNQNAIGGLIDDAGNFVQQAAHTAANDPAQALVDAAEAAPGLVASGGVAGLFVFGAEAGVATEVVGGVVQAATGDKTLTNFANDVLYGTADAAFTPATDPLASLEVVGGTIGTILGGEGTPLLIAGATKLGLDTAARIQSDQNIVDPKSGQPIGASSAAAGHTPATQPAAQPASLLVRLGRWFEGDLVAVVPA